MATVQFTDRIEEYWRRFQQACPDLAANRRPYEAFAFGDTAAMADELVDLVVRGIKTATSSLVWSYEDRGMPPMLVGDFHVVTDSRERPVCVIQTKELRVLPFEGVDERFAFDYGEGDRTMVWWRKHLWDYYARVCASLGREPSPSMPLLCERFAVVHTE